MTTLEAYLASDYVANQQDVAALRTMIEAAAQTIIRTHTPSGWSYEHRFSDDEVQSAAFSTGTMAMVLTSLGRTLGDPVFSGTHAVEIRDRKLRAQLREVFKTALKAFVTEIIRDKHLASGTFGKDNPLTLSHVADLHRHLTTQFATQRVEIKKAMAEAEKNLVKLLQAGLDCDLLPNAEGKYQQSVFVPLRTLRAARLLDLQPPCIDGRRFFEATLHEQLSFSAIPDSRFDPAELVFSLEGLLLCAEHAVDAAVVERVIEVLAEKQGTSSHWRPSKPFLTSGTGQIMLPISVEVANSLMRSLEIMDASRAFDTYSAKALPLLRRFWSWIRARAVRSAGQGSPCVGWHSEHINVPDLVHLWDTSQVIEFMVGYGELIRRETSKTTLRLSGLQIKAAEARSGTEREQWDASSLDLDSSPDTDLAGSLSIPKSSVYGRVGAQFVDGWASGSPMNYSMLLYGPPGTGKTSVARSLSKALQMPLITVTVSDFLGSGGANVEARAKAIFQTLEQQSDVIILFDEIDSFLLDRDSKFYREQDSLFQFLTPGMLPKLQNLRDAERSIFIIATNYENRIDPAIKRTGRIDQSYLVPLPNAAKRKAIMSGKKVPTEMLGKSFVTASVFLGYGDLVKVAGEVGPLADDADASRKSDYESDLLQRLSDAQRASALETYLARVSREGADFAPSEFAYMVTAAQEAEATDRLAEAAMTLSELANVDELRRQLRPETLKVIDDASKSQKASRATAESNLASAIEGKSS